MEWKGRGRKRAWPNLSHYTGNCNRSQWPRGLRRRSAAARLLRSWVPIPPGTWVFVCCECCVLSGRGLRDELITRPEESYRLSCVVVYDQETSRMRRPWPALGCSATGGGYRKLSPGNEENEENFGHDSPLLGPADYRLIIFISVLQCVKLWLI